MNSVLSDTLAKKVTAVWTAVRPAFVFITGMLLKTLFEHYLRSRPK